MRWPGRRTWLLVGLAWLALVGIAVAVAVEEGGHPQPPSFGPSPSVSCPGPLIGVHSSLAYDGDPQRRAAIIEADRQLLDAQVVRTSLLWNQIEPVQGQRDWSRLDSIVSELDRTGIEPLLVVLGSPPWANGIPTSTPGHYLYVPPRGPELNRWLERYSDFLVAAVERYKGVVERWEIWNEPNTAAFWRPHPDPVAYRRVYGTLRETIRRVDPSAQVAVGGLTSLSVGTPPNISGLDFLRSLTLMNTRLDNVAIHPYSDDRPPWVDVPGRNNFDGIERAHQLLRAEGLAVPIWVTEWGWSSDALGTARQARYVERSLELIENRYPFVHLATYFLDHDLPEHPQGLLDQDLQPKPAAAVFRRQAALAASRCRAQAR